MRLDRLQLRGFRNLGAFDLPLPAEGMVLLGPNAQGKTNLLEAIGYPVLFRALRGAVDTDVAAFGGPGFSLEAAFHDGSRDRTTRVTFTAGNRQKRILLDGAPVTRLSEAAGAWAAVAFLPRDVTLAGGPAAERRHFLDRMLSLASPDYLSALARYRAALAQRNAALRQGQEAMARVFDAPLAVAGSEITARRQRWAAGASERFAEGFASLGEAGPVGLSYRSDAALADPAGWQDALHRARTRDLGRRMTTIGPHRDDLLLTVGGRPLREFGSTGQQRSAAVALRLLELATLREARGVPPALLLDDVFAELDADRQARLADRLLSGKVGQVFVTAPREDELPKGLRLPIWSVNGGVVRTSR
ncbi:MAG TPA: DNA replication and repair protein RecF [Gemmatimonadales bacterium]|nr:DNA replication and repair protein RecF [Gemmatimonadales bacterium]